MGCAIHTPTCAYTLHCPYLSYYLHTLLPATTLSTATLYPTYYPLPTTTTHYAR